MRVADDEVVELVVVKGVVIGVADADWVKLPFLSFFMVFLFMVVAGRGQNSRGAQRDLVEASCRR